MVMMMMTVMTTVVIMMMMTTYQYECSDTSVHCYTFFYKLMFYLVIAQNIFLHRTWRSWN
jgi:hypothetical protein